MADNQRQHYVPRFYLEYFCNSDEKLCVYKKSEPDKPFFTSPQNIAHERYYYSPEIDGERMHDIEKMLAEFESKAQPIHKKLLDGKFPLSAEDKSSYAIFLAFSHVRTPTMRRAFGEIQGQAVKMVFDHLQRNNKFPEMPEQMKGMDLQINISRDATLEGMLHSFKPFYYAFCQMKWAVCTRTGDEEFITSDNPVCLWVNPETINPIYGGVGVANKTAEFSFPLSPNKILFMLWRHDYPDFCICPKQVVKDLNRLRAYEAEEIIISSQNKLGLRNLVNKYKDDRKSLTFPGASDNSPIKKINVKRKI